LILLVPLVFLAIKVIPRLLRRVKLTCNSELLLLVAIAICLGTAALAQAVGFSVALGAFLAGLSISGLPDLHDAHTQLVPLRDAFVALFFVSLGTLIDPKVLFNSLPLLGLMLLLIVVGKFLVWTTVVWLFPLSDPDRNSSGCRADTDRRALVRGRASRTIVGDRGGECFQHSDRRVVDFDITERFHRARRVCVARRKVVDARVTGSVNGELAPVVR
jgi:hypothetical protein